MPTKKIATKKKRAARGLPHELQAQLKQLQTALAAAEKVGVVHEMKMARIQCPGCGTLDLGVAWSKKTGWAMLCHNCSVVTLLSAIDPPDPEEHEVGERHVVTLRRTSGDGTIQ